MKVFSVRARAILAVAGLGLAASAAQASFGDTAVEFRAQRANGDFAVVAFDIADWGSWSGSGPTLTWSWDTGANFNYNIVSQGTGQVLGVIKKINMSLVQDPVINLTFDVVADTQTDFIVTSTLLSFTAINPAIGRANANVTVTDNDGDGASITGLHSNGDIYWAAYNGMVESFGSTNFHTGISGASTPNPFDSASASSGIPPWAAIAGPVLDMSAQFRFRVSPNDLATGSSSYEIIPTPGVLALAGVGGLLAARRRRA
jgi:hypothetical protein